MLLILLSASLLLLADARATTTKPCPARCPPDHRCEWMAVPDTDCYNPPCGEQPICAPILQTLSCANVLCAVGFKCIETPTGPQCVESERCATTGCPSGFKCDTSVFKPGTCIPVITCASTTCSPDSICSDSDPTQDAICLPVDPITCATILCIPGNVCIDGPNGSKCVPYPTCKTTKCPRGQKCVDHLESSATCEPVATCAATSCPVGSTCVDFPNKDAKCQTSKGYGDNRKCLAKCSAGQKCVFRPTPSSECYNPPCSDVPTCVSAFSDDETSCDQKQCYAGYKCVVQAGLARCVFHRTCEELTCPNGQRCEEILENARCVPIRTCQTLRCQAGQICSEENGLNAVCRPIQTCSTLLCNSKQVCRAGNGREDAICVDGASANPCASTTCAAGQSCQAVNGRAQCVPNSEIATPSPVVCNCRPGEKCVARAVVCVRAPCLPVLECRKARECSINEVFTDCAGCEPTCSNPSPICTLECRPARCVCRNGFIRDYSGVCVSANACSRRPDVGIPHHLNNCESLRCPVASTCFDYGDRAECLYGPLRDDSKLSLSGPVRATISPIRFTGSPKLSCRTVKCSADHQCVETSQGPQCQETRYTIGPIRHLSDNPRFTISPIRELSSCATVKCSGGNSCVETKKGPVCEPTRYTIGPVTPRYELFDSHRVTLSPVRLTGCHTVKCSAGHECVETPRGGVCQPTKVKGSCATILLHCVAGNACKDTPDGPRCLPTDTNVCNCPRNQKCVATPITCITTPCNPILSCQPLTKCGLNEEWRECSSCDTQCSNPDLMCPAVCGPPRCQCRNGFARGQNGECVPLKKCSKHQMGVKPATHCQYLRSKCSGTCHDYMDRAECIPSNQAALSDFRPNNVADGLRHGYGGFSNNYVRPPVASCELVDCRSGHRCIDLPTGPICVPGTNPSNSNSASCATVDCPSGQKCMDTPAGPICIPGVGGGSGSCATTKCAPDTRCQDTAIGPLCVPLSGNNNNSYNININCVCGAEEECVIVHESCTSSRCNTKSECRPKTGGVTVEPSITCANVRCAGSCLDTPTGPKCIPQPKPSCAAISCLVGHKCIDSPTGGRCVPSYSGGNSKDCRKANEELNVCGNHCEGSCEFVGENRLCTADCRPPACACVTGFYRNNAGECVSASECPSKQPVCTKPNEEVAQCGNHCEGSCDFVNEPRACTLDCRPPACACKSGFYRNSNGDCVSATQCPKKEPVCTRPNEELNQCGNHCEGSCQFVDEPRFCTADCRPPACACKSGYYRNDQGDCVISRLCPPKAPVCTKPNEVVGPCGSQCESTCRFLDNPRPCLEICNPPACMCKDGFHRNDNGDCVSSDQCTTQNGYGDESPLPDENNNSNNNLTCSSDERVNQCGNLCEAKCEHIGKGPVACVKICAPAACVCKDGFFRNKKGKCVGPNSCPNSPTYMGGKGGDGRIPYRH